MFPLLYISNSIDMRNICLFIDCWDFTSPEEEEKEEKEEKEGEEKG